MAPAEASALGGRAATAASRAGGRQRLLLGGALAALAAAVLATALAPTYVSPDSQHYLDVARSLEAGLGPVSFHLHLASPAVPSATGLWPGGYPAALAVLGRLGLDGARAPAVLNAAALALLVLSLWWLARLAALPGWLAALAAAAAAAHPSLRHVLSHTWSEPLFVALATAALALLAQALAARRPALALAAGLAAGLAFSVRYAGIFLVGYLAAAAVGWGLLERWRVRRHLAHLALLAAGPLLAAPLALQANLAAYGRPFGLPRLPVPDLAPALLDRGRELLAALDVLPSGAGLLLLVGALLLAGREPGPTAAPAPWPGPSPDRERRLVAALLAGWVPWYAAALLASVAGIVTDPIDQRLLSPVAPALVLLGFAVAGPRLARLAAGPALAAGGIALALAGHLDAAALRHRDPPVLEAPPELAAAARRLASPDTLLVASRGWDLRFASGAVVLEDGYPDMATLEPPAVFRFLDGPGRAFRRVVLVFQPDGSMPAGRLPAFRAAAGQAGWRSGGATAAGPATLLELER